VELVRDGVVGGGEAGSLDPVGIDQPSLRGVAQLAYEVHVLGRVHELELLDRRLAWGQEMAVLDEPRLLDQVHRELHADRLERMFI